MIATLDNYIASDPTLESEALAIAQQLRVFTADDLHSLETMITAQCRDRRVIGAVLKKLQCKGQIEAVCYVKSKRSECHGRPIIQWRVTK